MSALEGSEDTCVDPGTPQHIAPFEVDERLARERSKRSHHTVTRMSRDKCPVMLLAVAEGIEHPKGNAPLLQRFDGLDMEDVGAELRQLSGVGIGEFVDLACFGDEGRIGGIDPVDMGEVLHHRRSEEVRQ